jgi:hydroxymethylpyrimidine pyrophosphatase-like HAD family hydrolase
MNADTRRPLDAPYRRVSAFIGGAIKLVALDLDGTILEQGRVISPQVIAALRALDAAGVRCTTATGRPFAFQAGLFARHGLGTNGSNGRFPHALMVDEREIYLLDQAARAYLPHRAWNDAVRTHWDALHAVATGWLERARHEAAQRGWASSVPFPADEMYRRGLPTIAFADPDHAAGIQGWLATQLAANEPELACNRNVRLVQIHDALVGKGRVLAEIARHWDVAPDEVRCATTGNADEAIKDAVRRAGGYVAQGRIGAGVVETLRHHAEALGTLQLAL